MAYYRLCFSATDQYHMEFIKCNCSNKLRSDSLIIVEMVSIHDIYIYFCNRELCAMHKPGGTALPVATMVIIYF